MIALLADEAAVLVEHPCYATGHTSAEVLAGTAQHENGAPGHVLAAMIADTFDDGDSARIADGEALAGASGSQQAARCGAIERDIAEQNVMRAFTRGVTLGTKHDLSTAQTLADEVIG